jgi:hypothetical protein
VLIASYPNENIHAGKVEPALTEMEAGLRSFKLTDEHTLYDVADGFVKNGKKLGALLSDRADALSDADRGKVRNIRSRNIRLINKFRSLLEEELEDNPDLPRDLDARLFGYLDQLAADKNRKSSGSAATRRANPTGEPNDGNT